MSTHTAHAHSPAKRIVGANVWMALASLALLVGQTAAAAETPREAVVLPTTIATDVTDPTSRDAAETVCPFEDDGHCKLWAGMYMLMSDRRSGSRWADDFRPDGPVISRVCWWPCYLKLDPIEECVHSPPPDSFMVRFYHDVGGMIGSEIGPAGGQPLVPDDKVWVGGFSRCWSYTAPLETPVWVTPGDCYWIEITGFGSADGCTVFMPNSDEGNGYSLYDFGGTYDPTDVDSFDTALCIDSGLASSDDCGLVSGACCFCNGTCLDADDGMDHVQCAQQAGIFFPGDDCDGLDCGLPPPNDDCADAMALEHPGGHAASDIVLDFYTWCATTDGPSPVFDCEGGSSPVVGQDVWYSYVAPHSADLTVSLCNGTFFDTVLVVYDGGDTCACPAGAGSQLACGDDTCGVSGGASMVELPAASGNCYVIRIGGWGTSSGTGTLTVSLAVADDAVIPTVSQWGLVALALLLLVAAKTYFRRYRVGTSGRRLAGRGA